MARLARVVVPGLPHHITQRGNRQQQTFFCDEDYRSYLELMGQWCGVHQVEIWAYCLMPNQKAGGLGSLQGLLPGVPTEPDLRLIKPPLSLCLIPDPGRMDIGDQDLKTDNLLHDDVCSADLLERESAMSFHSRRRSRPSAQTTHRPRGGTCRDEPSLVSPRCAACPLALEARGPSPATTTRGDRVAWSRSSHGSARNATRDSAPTCSCSPSGILGCDTLPR